MRIFTLRLAMFVLFKGEEWSESIANSPGLAGMQFPLHSRTLDYRWELIPARRPPARHKRTCSLL